MWILIPSIVAEMVAEGILSRTESTFVVLLLINLALPIVGFFMVPVAAITILTHVLLPVAAP